MNCIIICGTDTDVGKTVVSALVVQGLNATYWKPVQSGLDGGGDTGRVRDLLKLSKRRYIKEAYCFKSPVSPHWAAEKESCRINPSELVLPSISGTLVVETAGGLMVPLTRQWLQMDQLKEWNQPVLLVARSGLGTLNHTLLSLEALKLRKIPILGLILNGDLHADNPTTLEQLGGVPVIAQLPKLNKLTAESLDQEWHKQNLNQTFKRLLKT